MERLKREVKNTWNCSLEDEGRVKMNLDMLWRMRQIILSSLELLRAETDLGICLNRMGTAPQKGRILAFFAHYDSANKGVSSTDRFHIEALLQDLDCDMVFCSTSVEVTDTESIEYLSKKTVQFLIRDNEGYDFGSWKACLEMMGERIDRYDYILFVNNSVIGPFFSLKWIPDRANSESVLGMTMSSERQIHLQSYFILVPKTIFSKLEFKKFWLNMKLLNKKTNVVFAHEMGLSRLFARMKVPIKPLFSFEAGDKNPTHRLWDKLIYEANFPYLKKDLFRRKLISEKQVVDLNIWLSTYSSFQMQFFSHD